MLAGHDRVKEGRKISRSLRRNKKHIAALKRRMRGRDPKTRHEKTLHRMFPEANYSIILAHVQPDLTWPDIKLAVELDGQHHRYGRHPELDKLKESVLRFLGWTVLRFWNHELENNPEAVRKSIESTILKLKGIRPIA
jgi:very-short-patch-repair endonuclease